MPRVASPAYRPLSLAWHRARQTQASARSTARAGFGRPKSSKFYAQTCAEAGDESRPAPTCNATALYIPLARQGEGLQECRRRAASGPTARARESAGDMENAPPCRWDPPDVSRQWHGADCNWRWEGPFFLASRVHVCLFKWDSERFQIGNGDVRRLPARKCRFCDRGGVPGRRIRIMRPRFLLRGGGESDQTGAVGRSVRPPGGVWLLPNAAE